MASSLVFLLALRPGRALRPAGGLPKMSLPGLGAWPEGGPRTHPAERRGTWGCFLRLPATDCKQLMAPSRTKMTLGNAKGIVGVFLVYTSATAGETLGALACSAITSAGQASSARAGCRNARGAAAGRRRLSTRADGQSQECLIFEKSGTEANRIKPVPSCTLRRAPAARPWRGRPGSS